MMDNVKWYGGKSLHRSVQGAGRVPSTLNWLVAAFFQAQADGVSIKEMKQMLMEISTYDPEKHKQDQAEIIRQLQGL